jgi:putative ABC transport system permease protein
MRVPFVAGSFEALDKNSMIITTDEAADRGLAVGSTVTVVLKDGSSHPLKIVGVMDSKLMGRRVVDRTLFDGTGTEIVTGGIMIKTVGQQPRSALEAIVDKYPTAKLESRQEFINTQSKQIDGFLNLIYGLLGMSLFIAVIGIVITLLLAVYERRRELGLVRAVGMTRRQVRSSVLWESMITALIGTVLGVVLGIFLGWIIVQALKDSGLNVFALPVSTIVGTVVGALALAAVASFLPARRAAKADILQAIATT